MLFVKQTRTPEEFKEITKEEFHKLWYLKAMTMGQIGKMYGVTRKEVNAKRKEFKLTTLGCAVLYKFGDERWRDPEQEEKRLKREALKKQKEIERENRARLSKEMRKLNKEQKEISEKKKEIKQQMKELNNKD